MMIQAKSKSRIFFGWWIVLVTGILSGLGLGFYIYGFSALFKPIASELGFSRAITSVAAGIGIMVGSLSAPLTGWIVDKFGPRWVTFAGVLIIGIGLTIMNFIISVWGYYLVWGLMMGTGVHLGLTIAVDKTLTNWFVRKRGLAMGIKFALIGLISAVVLPTVSWLASMMGWRMACLTWAAIMFAGAPLALAFVRQKRPEYYGLLPDGAEVDPNLEETTESMSERGIAYASSFQETEFTFRQAVKTWAYWILTGTYGAQLFIMGGFTTHCIPFLTDMSIDPTWAGGMMGIMVIFTIPSRFISGYLADRVSKDRLKLLLALPFVLQAIGIGAIQISQTTIMVYVLLILYGLGHGSPTPLIIVMMGRYFGRKAYGSIYGTSMLFLSPVALFAPIFSGWLYDTTGSYMIAFIIFVLLSIFAVVLLCLIRPPKLPAQIDDIHQFM